MMYKLLTRFGGCDQTSKLKISVIVSTYNWPEALEQVLCGLRDQTLKPFEVIVADDGSGPETAELIKNFAMPFPLHHVWHEDRGFRLAAIRNVGIRKSSGDYLIFMDGDCIPSPTYIQDHAILARRGYWTAAKRILITKKGKHAGVGWDDIRKGAGHWLALWKKGYINRPRRFIHIPGLALASQNRIGSVYGCNMAVWYSDVFRVNGFEESFTTYGGEDGDFSIRLLKAGIQSQHPPFSAMCFHIWHPERSGNNDFLLSNTKKSDSCLAVRGLSCYED